MHLRPIALPASHAHALGSDVSSCDSVHPTDVTRGEEALAG